ncbi:MAG TPA: anti-sigma factor [Pyrinomonadaceae bacterium]|jgi:anti-sigma-K factor RskA
MSHEDYKEMIPAHALSALDWTDDRALNEHLAQCVECRQELNEWQQTAAAVALTASPAEPSPLVRERILSQIRSERDESITPKIVPFKPSQKNIWSSFGSLGAVAAAVLFVFLLGYVFLLWRENRAIKQELQTMREANQQIQDDLKWALILQKRGSKLMELNGTTAAPGASAKLAYDQSGHAMVMMSGLPTPPAGKEYQLWFIVADKPPLRGKTFSTDSHGKGMMEDQLPDVALKSAAFAVTLEPQGGSASPTMPMYLRS